MKYINNNIILILFIIIYSNLIYGQCCAGDFIVKKLARSGIQAGYGVQFFDPAGLNRYVDYYNVKYASSITAKMDKFGTAYGFIIGANLIQFQLDEFLIGFKINFSQVKQNRSAKRTLIVGGDVEEKFDLSLNSFGLGITTSLVISKRFEAKFLEALVTWNSAKLMNSYTDPFLTSEQVLTSPRRKLGLTLGAGVTFYPLPPSLALEATGGYSFISLGKMQFDNGDLLAQTPDGGPAMENFIIGGGFYAVLQLSVSLPLK